ncbi:MAG: Alpha/Beta hydrolase protein [Podila humilis]|nr:MAG: Alpha/Beta hydrolase protein [Podila humilis]
MPPQATVRDPLIQLLTGSSGSEEIRYDDHYNEANCLNLNIYMPNQVPTDAKLPVMVFIFGGGLKSGGNGVPLYDCTNFVAQSAALHKPVVAVVINYRLNYFGFLASKELRTETQGDSIGNLGLLDQILALQWVQDHIHTRTTSPS